LQNNGLHAHTAQLSSEIDYLMLYFTQELLEDISDETNRYAREGIQNVSSLPTYSVWYSYQDVTVEELKAFSRVRMNMVLNGKAKMKYYFSESRVDRIPFFKDVFSQHTYFQIFLMFYLCPHNALGEGMASNGK
jgi:hypothetical protein